MSQNQHTTLPGSEFWQSVTDQLNKVNPLHWWKSTSVLANFSVVIIGALLLLTVLGGICKALLEKPAMPTI